MTPSVAIRLVFTARLVYCLGLAAVTLLMPLSASGVLFFQTGDPTHNTTAPTGNLAGSGWELQGRWRGFLGTPIAPNLFLTARHVGGGPGEMFNFRGTNYPVIATYADTQSDLHILEVCGTFPAHAELYPFGDELGKVMMVFGRGTQRGPEVFGNATVGTELKGWQWATGDGVMRWGQNVVATVSDAVAGLGPLLRADFDRNAPGECHLSSGDSGGGVFIKDGNSWKLAGINLAVDGPYNTANSGPGFNAALFDVGGLYQTNAVTGTWDYAPPNPAVDLPSAFYATRISGRLDWINAIITEHAVDRYVPILEMTTSLDAPFSVHPSYVADEITRTITLDQPSLTVFLRLNGCRAHEILNMELRDGKWVLEYGP